MLPHLRRSRTPLVEPFLRHVRRKRQRLYVTVASVVGGGVTENLYPIFQESMIELQHAPILNQHQS